MKLQDAITDVPGIRVGHAHDSEAITGCTVVLCKKGAVGGVDQRGGAPGTRETDLLRPMAPRTEGTCGSFAFGWLRLWPG